MDIDRWGIMSHYLYLFIIYSKKEKRKKKKKEEEELLLYEVGRG